MASQLTPYEELSYELNRLRERRVAERRLTVRDSLDWRQPAQAEPMDSEPHPNIDSSNQTP